MRDLLTRTPAHARKSFRMYAEDQVIFDQLEFFGAGVYAKLMCEAAALQSSETQFPYHAESAGIPLSVFTKLESLNLISKSEKGCIVVNGFEQRLTNKASKERKRRFDQRKRREEIEQLCKSIIKNERPDGVPSDAIVWGGNEKRWACHDDVVMAMALHKYISGKGSKIEIGITFINQVRLLRSTVADGLEHNRMAHIYRGLAEYFDAGGAITTDNLRRVIESVCL